MITRKIVQNTLVSTTLAIAALVGASVRTNSVQAAESCVFDKYTPVAAAPFQGVKALEAVQPYGSGSYTFLKGAQLFIRAQEGLTKEWLALSIERALDEGRACNPDVRPVQVNVTSSGNGFWVQLTAHDQRQAAALLRWASQIVKTESQRQPAAAVMGAR